MALSDTIAANPGGRTVAIRVLLGDRGVNPDTILDVESSSSTDELVGSGSVTLARLPHWYSPPMSLEIWLGWNGETECVFKGTVGDDGQELEGGAVRLTGYDQMEKVKSAPTDVLGLSWSDSTGSAIVADCLDAAGVTDYNLAAGWATFGNQEDVVLPEGQSYASLINDLDEIERMCTFGGPGGRVLRVPRQPVPSASAAYAYVEGVDLFGSPSRERSISGVYNRVVVNGHPDASVSESRQAASPYLTGYRTYTIPPHRLIDTSATADELARLLMLELNRRVDRQSFDLLGNPYLCPGQTISVTAPTYGITQAANYWVRSVSHRASPTSIGYMCSVQVEGGVGDAGYSTGSPPIADFTFTVEREPTTDLGTIYLVYATSAVRDYDTPADQLTLAWENSANADTGTGVDYTTYFSAAELASGVTITLTVTDPESNTDSIAKALDGSTSFVLTPLFVANDSRADAFDGSTWRTWTPSGGALVKCTTVYSPGSVHLFGLDSGALYSTDDYLASAPTLVHTFPAGITWVDIRRSDENDAVVGLYDGKLYRTTNLDEGADSDWTLLHDFGVPVTHVDNGWDDQIRVSAGGNEYRSGPPYGTWTVLSSFEDEALRIALGNQEHWVSGREDSESPLVPVRLEGTGLSGSRTGALAGLPSDLGHVPGLAQNFGTGNRLYVLGRDGRSYTAEYTTSRESAVAGAVLPDSSTVEHLICDPEIRDKVYACDADTGVWKGIRRMNTWIKVRAVGGTLHSRLVGTGIKPFVLAPAAGARVLASGAEGTAPRVWWCADVFAPSPTWTSVSTDLPVSGIAYDVRLDGGDLDTAYVRVGGATSGLSESGGIWRNDAWATGGSWSEVLTIAEARALVVSGGIADDLIEHIGLEAYAVGSGHLYALAAVYSDLDMGGGVIIQGRRHSFWLFSSTDQGETWAALKFFDEGHLTSQYIITPPRFALTVDLLSPSTVYALITKVYGPGELYVYRSTDGGATSSLFYTLDSGANPSLQTGPSVQLVVPFVGIGSGYGGLLARAVGKGGATTAKFQRFHGASLEDVGSLNPLPYAVLPAYYATQEPSRYVVAKLNGTPYDLWATVDGGATWGLLASNTRRPYATADWQPSASEAPRFYGAGSNAAGNGAGVWYSLDLVNLTSCGDPSWGTTVELRGLTVDPRA